MEGQENEREERTRKDMSFLDHLEELRRRIIWSLISIGVSGILGYIFGKEAITFLARPVGKLYFFSPPEAFLVRLKIALVVGIFISVPFLLYQLWAFIRPGLLEKERKYAFPLIVAGTVLFFLGASFAFFVGLPVGIKVLLSFGGENLVGLLNANRYINFALILVLSFALLFQLPIITVFLVKLGVIDPKSVRKRRREVILGIFIVVAIITPSVDMVSLLLLAIPLIVLFELSILASTLLVPKK